VAIPPTLSRALLDLDASLAAVHAHADDKAQPGRVPRVGYLVTHTAWTPYFQEAMRNLGYVEAQNLLVEWRVSDDKLDPLPSFARELVALGVDVITASSPVTMAARVDPFAKRAGIKVAFHNHSTLQPNEFARPDDFATAMKDTSASKDGRLSAARVLGSVGPSAASAVPTWSRCRSCCRSRVELS
jgi:putative ABC transport system substrate-binding protein